MLGVRELSGGRISILSGQRLDVDAGRRLQGECDFILALSEPLPRLRAPLVTIVEAKKNDIEAGLGQCIAQMVAAQLFNERAGHSGVVFGCVTTGEDWQFLRLEGQAVLIDTTRRYINDVGSILAAFLSMAGQVRTPKQARRRSPSNRRKLLAISKHHSSQEEFPGHGDERGDGKQLAAALKEFHRWLF